jgi:hypothetical protein
LCHRRRADARALPPQEEQLAIGIQFT